MFSQEAVDRKYKKAAAKQGVSLEIVYRPGFSKAQEIEETERGFTIRLDSDRIHEAEYETYAAYNVRKILLPRLRLETERLTLRPFARGDAEAYFALFSDKNDAYMDSSPLFAERNGDYERLMDAFSTQTRYSILRKETGEIAGTIQLQDMNDRAVETMEIGYGVFSAYRRRGYAYEALSALLRCLLYELHLDLVLAGAFPDNAPSLELIRKLGFHYEGRKRKAGWNELRGPVDLEYYYLERDADAAPAAEQSC